MATFLGPPSPTSPADQHAEHKLGAQLLVILVKCSFHELNAGAVAALLALVYTIDPLQDRLDPNAWYLHLQEPFVNFSRCDVRARRKLFNGWLELLQLLHGREQRCLAAEDPALQSQAVRWAEVAQQVATAYSIATTIAVDQVAEAVRVLHCIQEVRGL